MITTIILKELRGLAASPKFTATFLVAAALMLLSVWIGVREYKTSVASYEAVQRLSDEDMRQQSSWAMMSTTGLRRPDPLQVLSIGVSYDIGRMTDVSSRDQVRLRNSVFTDDPIFAVFRNVDFIFIVLVVLSLFAILFTYDAVNGEREQGTLQLSFANALPRAQYIAAKFAGCWLGLVIPLSIPLVLSLAMLPILGVPLGAGDWLRIGGIILLALLYFSFFTALGILMSTLTKRSSVSFLLSLVVWVVLVLIIPRAGVMAAGQMLPVPSEAEVEGQREAFARNRMSTFMEQMGQRWQAREQQMHSMSDGEREAYRDANMWKWMQEEDAARKQQQKDVDEFAARLREDHQNRKNAQQRLAFWLTRFSPASSFQLAAMAIAGSDLGLKERYERSFNTYRTAFTDYTDRKQKESGGGMGGFRITMDSKKGFSFSMPRERGTLNFSDMPRFEPPMLSLADVFGPAIPDFGLIALFALLAFSGAFVRFLRYDVR